MLMTCKQEKCADKVPVDMSLGLCVPKVCSQADVTSLLPYLLPIMNDNVFPRQFAKMIEQGEISSSFALTPDEVDIVLSADLNDQATSFKFMNMVALLLFFSILLVVISSSIGHWKNYGENLQSFEGQSEPMWKQMYKCFAIQKSMSKLFMAHKYSKEDSEFEILNFVKVFSIAMIVLGNTYFFILSGPVRNMEAKYSLMGSTTFTFVLAADL